MNTTDALRQAANALHTAITWALGESPDGTPDLVQREPDGELSWRKKLRARRDDAMSRLGEALTAPLSLPREPVLEVFEGDPGYWKVVVRFNGHYGHTLGMLSELFRHARTDFPDLDAKDVEVVQYGGEVQNRTWGIEFVCHTAPPAKYTRVKRLEKVR